MTQTEANQLASGDRVRRLGISMFGTITITPHDGSVWISWYGREGTDKLQRTSPLWKLLERVQ